MFAASNNSYSLSSPVRLMTGPTIELEGGTLSVPPSRTGLARGGQMIAMLITGNGPQMTFEKATFTADFSTREPTFSQDPRAGDIAPLVKALQRMQFDGLVVRDSSCAHQDVGRIDRRYRERQRNDLLQAERRRACGRVDQLPRREAELRHDARRQPRCTRHVASGQRLVRPAPRCTATLEGSLMLGESPQLLSPQAELVVRRFACHRALARRASGRPDEASEPSTPRGNWSGSTAPSPSRTQP